VLTDTCQTPLQDVASALDISITEFGNPHYDDPSLALLFSQLKSKTLQTAKGTSEISGRVEFNFVLQIARVFTRMGERPPFFNASIGLLIGLFSSQGATPSHWTLSGPGRSTDRALLLVPMTVHNRLRLRAQRQRVECLPWNRPCGVGPRS